MNGQRSAVVLGAMLLLCSTGAVAQLTSAGVLDRVVSEFATRASAWQTVIMNAATWLFWTLGTISLVWTFGFMALRKADIGEFFAEFIRFTLFFGFMLWLLRNGPNFADSIIRSLRQLGDKASGTSGLSPSGIVDVGFTIWKQAIGNLSFWSPVDSFVGIVLSAVILVMLTAIAVNMLLLLVSGWILMYAGIFFLGFGGSRWTSEMAINYYKTVLGVAVQLFAMTLVVGIGTDLLATFYAKMTKGALNFEELGVMLVACFALLLLVIRVPSLLGGIVSGGGLGAGGGVGNFGAREMGSAALGAAAAASMAGAATAGAATNIAGGASALKAAFSAAQQNMASGGGMFAGSGDTNHSPGSISNSLAAAMGMGARFAVDMGSHLAQGAASVAKATAGQTVDDFKDRVSETMGGRIAAAIKASGQAVAPEPAFEGNSLAAASDTSVDPDAEVAAFRDRRT
jgi:type IV secretion system protein TrbL